MTDESLKSNLLCSYGGFRQMGVECRLACSTAIHDWIIHCNEPERCQGQRYSGNTIWCDF